MCGIRLDGGHMKTSSRLSFKMIVACSLASLPASAQLPALDKQSWLGHFVGYENSAYRFGYTAMGVGIITPVGNSGPMGKDRQVGVAFVVEEMMPDGKVVTKTLDTSSLESEQAATEDPKNIVFRGSVTGGAKFEGHIHEEKGTISLGGRVIENGSLKNPLRFGIRFDFGSPYRYVSAEDRAGRVFERRVRKDEVRLVWTDGKRVKQSAAESVSANSPEINGPGISRFEYEADGYSGKKFFLDAGENARMLLSNRSEGMLIDGFQLTWYPDLEKDPEGTARLRVLVR
jgi:hypothetical protein